MAGDAWRFVGIMSHGLTTCVIFVGLRPIGNDRRLGCNPIDSYIQHIEVDTNDHSRLQIMVFDP